MERELIHQRQPNIAAELALLLAARDALGRVLHLHQDRGRDHPADHPDRRAHAIAGVLLLAIMRWRGVRMPADAATWRRFLFQACLNSVIPWTMIAWGERSLDAGRCDHPQFDVADIHLFPDARRHAPRGADLAKAVRRGRRHGRHLPDRRRAGAGRTGRATDGADRDGAGRRSATPAPRSSAAASRVSIRWRRRRARCSAARRC